MSGGDINVRRGKSFKRWRLVIIENKRFIAGLGRCRMKVRVWKIFFIKDHMTRDNDMLSNMVKALVSLMIRRGFKVHIDEGEKG